jgi:hypothetical protein
LRLPIDAYYYTPITLQYLLYHNLCIARRKKQFKNSPLTTLAVTKDWLLACASNKTWVCEKPFLIGGSSVFTEGKPMPKVTKVPLGLGPGPG